MHQSQPFLRRWIRERANRMRVTNVALAKALDRDESLVRNLLSDWSTMRVDFERQNPLRHTGATLPR